MLPLPRQETLHGVRSKRHVSIWQTKHSKEEMAEKQTMMQEFTQAAIKDV